MQSMSPASKIGHQHRILASYDVDDRLGCQQHLNQHNVTNTDYPVAVF